MFKKVIGGIALASILASGGAFAATQAQPKAATTTPAASATSPATESKAATPAKVKHHRKAKSKTSTTVGS